MATQFPYPVVQNQATIIQKKTMGRRKIEIKPIKDKNRLQVTFSKRRGGVFKKASELSVLCGAEVAIIVRSTANKVYTFGNPDVGSVLHLFETGSSSHVTEPRESPSSQKGYNEAVRKLEKEKKRVGEELHVPLGMNWWEIGFEGMELYELEEYKAALEGLKSKVSKRVDEIEKNKVGFSLMGFDEGKADCKYGDWKKALLCQDALFHAGETSSMFGGLKVEEGTGCDCSSSSNLVAYPTGGQCYVDNGCLEDIFKNMS